MINLATLKKSAQITTNEKGEKVIQFPIELWEAFAAESDPLTSASENSQVEGMMKAISDWEKEFDDPDDTPQWWSEFRDFLQDTRLYFEENSLPPSEEV